MEKRMTKDPSAVLDYKFDLAGHTNGSGCATDWLQSGDLIESMTITAAAGLTVDSSSITDSGTSVTVWLSGGTVGKNYDVSCNFVTWMGREDSRALTIVVKTR